ncbi:MAG: hypothetical protein KAH14_08960 [Clostridiales bacterium]|nr:hypothetical protein [Clostridiales bacterium]
MYEHERILSVLNREKPDRTPWFADLSYLYSSMVSLGTLEDKYKGEIGYLEFHKYLGAGICFYAPYPWTSKYSAKIEYKVNQTDNKRLSLFSTPIGEISCEERYLPDTFSWAITSYFINTIEDLRVMNYVHKNILYSENYKEFQRISELWGDYGIAAAIPSISSAPLQKLLARWAGIENTVNLYMDYEDEFISILDEIDDSESTIFNILCSSPCEYVEFAENLSSEVTGASFFEKFNKPHYMKRNQQLHNAGKFTGIHIDGTLKPCFSMLSDCGFDVAEAVTPYPLGDIKIRDLRKEAGENLIIWGGLPGVMFSPLYSEQQFKSHLEELLETFPLGSGFVLGVADQVPPDGLISRIKYVREIIG